MVQLEMFPGLQSARRAQQMHPNSIGAYHEEGVELSKRSALIVEHFAQVRHPMTDRQVMEGLQMPDMNAVRPRITELIKRGVLREVGTTIDYVTGRRVRIVGRTAKFVRGTNNTGESYE